MRQIFVVVACMAAMLTACTADARAYKLSATGQVTSIRLHDYDTKTDSTISGLIGIGDRFNVNALFDTSNVSLGALYDSDPTVNVYWLLGTQTKIFAGNYQSSFGPRFTTSSSAQFWNDRNVVGSTDSQSFGFDNVYYSGPYPYNLPNGALRTERVSVYAFDWTHLVRNSDLIRDIDLSSTLYNSNSMSYVFSSADGGQIRQAVFLDIGSVNWTIGGVPEPASWTMMIMGFGLVGLATRRSKSVTRCASIT